MVIDSLTFSEENYKFLRTYITLTLPEYVIFKKWQGKIKFCLDTKTQH